MATAPSLGAGTDVNEPLNCATGRNQYAEKKMNTKDGRKLAHLGSRRPGSTENVCILDLLAKGGAGGEAAGGFHMPGG